MLTKTIRLQDSVRLHARPAGQIAEEAKRYQSMIMLSAGMHIADAKQVLSVMRLGSSTESEIEITVEGPDENEALQGVERVFVHMKE